MESGVPAREPVVARVHQRDHPHAHVVLQRAVDHEVKRIMGMFAELRLMVRALFLITEDPRHAGVHVVEQVAVEQPVAALVGLELDRPLAHRRDVDGVLQRRSVPLAFEHSEEVAVQVNRVVHHRVVEQLQPQHFAALDLDHAVLGHGLAVERPDVALHVAGQPEFDPPPRQRRGQRGGLQGAQLRVGRQRALGFHLHRGGPHVVHRRHEMGIHRIDLRPRDVGRRMRLTLA